jgi:RNase P subunit RPR2
VSEVKVTCPTCGHVLLPAAEVRLVLRADDPYYVFRCPRCGGRVRRTAPEDVAGLLADGGAVAVRLAST